MLSGATVAPTLSRVRSIFGGTIEIMKESAAAALASRPYLITAEIARLLSRPAPPGAAAHWLTFRRRHQTRAR